MSPGTTHGVGMLMITVIEIWPNGSRLGLGAREISRATIANVSDLRDVSDYVAVLVDDRGTRREVVVRGHRRSDGVWALLSRVFSPDCERASTDRARTTERLGEVLDGIWARRQGRRPWLFLDLEGVMVPVADDYGDPAPADDVTWNDARGELFDPADLRRWANRLDAAFDVVWVSDRVDRVEQVADRLALPAWPVLRVDGPGEQVSSRVAAITAHLARDPRPFAWVDDNLDRDLIDSIAPSDQPRLPVVPLGGVGLTEQHVDLLVRFAST